MCGRQESQAETYSNIRGLSRDKIYSSRIPLLLWPVDARVAPNRDARQRPAELGMAPNVLERRLSAVPTLKGDEAVKEGLLKYRNASLRCFTD